MSTETPRNFSAAMESLARVDAQNREAARHAERVPDVAKPTAAAPAPIRLLDHEPAAEMQRQREGAAVLGAMHAAGVGTGQEWHSGGSLAGGDR